MNKIHFDCANGLKAFKAPVIIIQGENDIIEKKTAFKAAKVLSNSKVVFVENCAHYGWLENPGKYLNEVAGFVKRL